MNKIKWEQKIQGKKKSNGLTAHPTDCLMISMTQDLTFDLSFHYLSLCLLPEYTVAHYIAILAAFAFVCLPIIWSSI